MIGWFENYFSADTIYVGISLDTISINTMCVDTNSSLQQIDLLHIEFIFILL